MWKYPKHYDVIVVGAGHAGIEAARAASLMGMQTLLITTNIDTIGKMSCNPSIGGTSKGHIVREIDALGGFMGKAIDKTGIHFRMLNASKGPAVWSPRAQADKLLYEREMKRMLEGLENLDIKQGSAQNILTEKGSITGLETKEGITYLGKTVIISAGTFMRGLVHIGEKNFSGGRASESASEGLSKSLEDLGFRLSRLKTGTPARVNLKTIDLAKCEKQPGEENVYFSYDEKLPRLNQIACYITWTSPKTQSIVTSNIHRSPMYSGKIKSVGPRYCPSIEDKYMRFPDKERHQIFLEPEGLETNEVYVNGISTCLPFDVQEDLVHSITGLEKASIMRPGYAIEYDFVLPGQIKASLESHAIESLFLAGQINGTTGYEEAAGQGIIAGINAALKVQNKPSFILTRSESYIGVMIDDLITQEHTEPYRMFTSRAEFRLILRQDNADLRLRKHGYELGLITKAQFAALNTKKRAIEEVEALLHTTKKRTLAGATPYYQILSRPETSVHDLEKEIGDVLAPVLTDSPDRNQEVLRQVEISAKYAGYLKRQEEDVKKLSKADSMKVPQNFDFEKVQGLRSEAKEKLMRFQPENLGQASRIAGVSPSDVHVLMVAIGR